MRKIKKYFELWYWALMTIVISLILTSVMDSFGEAFFMAVMLLPGILFVKFFIGDISFKNQGQGILHTIYFVSIVLLIEYLSIIFVYGTLFDYTIPRGLILNPFFIWFMLGALLSIEMLLKIKFFTPEEEEERYVTFISDRVKVSLELDSVAYIESRDYQVLVVTVSGQSYPTRMKISQWETVLDRRFLRVHRSFIVNRKHITKYDSRAVWLGDLPIEISRKYKEGVMEKLDG